MNMDLKDFRNEEGRAYIVGVAFCCPPKYVRWTNSRGKMWTWTHDITKAESFGSYEEALDHFRGERMQKLIDGDENIRILAVKFDIDVDGIAGKDMPDTNKYGVPYHSYMIFLANGEEKMIDVGIEEDWGDIQGCLPGDVLKSKCSNAVGWGNDGDGHVEIVKVVDLEDNTIWAIGTKHTPRQWAMERVWCYSDNYG